MSTTAKKTHGLYKCAFVQIKFVLQKKKAGDHIRDHIDAIVYLFNFVWGGFGRKIYNENTRQPTKERSKGARFENFAKMNVYKMHNQSDFYMKLYTKS